jgi:transcriptional regulator with XRE-family HTH domain
MGRGASAIRAVLARNVRRLRLARGLSQEALAADAGLHQGLISDIENEVSNPELDTIGRLATALGARPRDLFEE